MPQPADFLPPSSTAISISNPASRICISFAVPHLVSKLRAQGVERGRKFFWCDQTGQEILVKQKLINLLKGIVAGRGRLSARVVSSCVISHAFKKYSPELLRDFLHGPWLEPLWCHADTKTCHGVQVALGCIYPSLSPEDGFAVLEASWVWIQ